MEQEASLGIDEHDRFSAEAHAAVQAYMAERQCMDACGDFASTAILLLLTDLRERCAAQVRARATGAEQVERDSRDGDLALNTEAYFQAHLLNIIADELSGTDLLPREEQGEKP